MTYWSWTAQKWKLIFCFLVRVIANCKEFFISDTVMAKIKIANRSLYPEISKEDSDFIKQVLPIACSHLQGLSLPLPLYPQLLVSLAPSSVSRSHSTKERAYVIQVFFYCCLFSFLLRRTSPRLDPKWKWVLHCAEWWVPWYFHTALSAAGVSFTVWKHMAQIMP